MRPAPPSGSRAFVLGHHYQRDEVIAFADVTGDSFKLAREAAARPEAEFIVFCGVHFMAESADILTADHQQVILPDLAAGCSMADMAAIDQVEDAWDVLIDAGVGRDDRPRDVHELDGGDQGVHRPARRDRLHSSNAHVALRWAFDRVGGVAGRGKVLFLPDQHLGRNTAVLQLGHLARTTAWCSTREAGRRSDHAAAARRAHDPVARPLLGARAVLGPERHGHAAGGPRRDGDRAPGVPGRGGPAADLVGSTEYIVKVLDAAAPGVLPGRSVPSSTWCVASRPPTRTRTSTTSTPRCASARP